MHMYITAVDSSDQHIAKMKVFMENKTRIKQPIYKIHAKKPYSCGFGYENYILLLADHF